jgi:hypothetical protein
MDGHACIDACLTMDGLACHAAADAVMARNSCFDRIEIQESTVPFSI